MDGKDIINALTNDPEAIKNCQWEKNFLFRVDRDFESKTGAGKQV